ncbi:MAG: hypoxanthine phosphoribosyltransferase [Anaerolineae bacterium]|nr:hypoxanthine phosphoribosyltransferase [Anaerolineae bacterium]
MQNNQPHPDIARILVPEDTIQAHVKVLAHQISRDYADVDSIYMIGVLRGSFMFLADLVRQINVPTVVDFMAISSYSDASESGEVRIVMDLHEPIVNKHVIVVEDIVDSGQTMSYLYHTLKGRGPASLRTCTLVQKHQEYVSVPLDYLGFNIPDVWVVGYGLHYEGRHRTLPYIAELKETVYKK